MHSNNETATTYSINTLAPITTGPPGATMTATRATHTELNQQRWPMELPQQQLQIQATTKGAPTTPQKRPRT